MFLSVAAYLIPSAVITLSTLSSMPAALAAPAENEKVVTFPGAAGSMPVTIEKDDDVSYQHSIEKVSFTWSCGWRSRALKMDWSGVARGKLPAPTAEDWQYVWSKRQTAPATFTGSTVNFVLPETQMTMTAEQEEYYKYCTVFVNPVLTTRDVSGQIVHESDASDGADGPHHRGYDLMEVTLSRTKLKWWPSQNLENELNNPDNLRLLYGKNSATYRCYESCGTSNDVLRR